MEIYSLGKIDSCPAGLKPATLSSIAHDYRIASSPRLVNYDDETEQRENQALVGAIPYCGEYPGPRLGDKFRSANQMDGISKADEIKWLPVNL